MKTYQKLMHIIEKFLLNPENVDAFCNQYMNTFYDLTDLLAIEVAPLTHEIFDDINLICDSYEADIAIREDDCYCIDEKMLIKKVEALYLKLKQSL